MLNRFIGGFVLLFVLFIYPINAQATTDPSHERLLLDSISTILRQSLGLILAEDSLKSNESANNTDTILHSDSLLFIQSLDSIAVQLDDSLHQHSPDSVSPKDTQIISPIPKEPELSALHRYIRDYDVFQNRVHPQLPLVLPEDTVLDYPKMSPLFMPVIFNARKREFRLDWKEEKRQIIPEDWIKSQAIQQMNGMPYVKRLARQILLAFEVEQIDKIRYLESDLPQPERLEVPLEANRQIQWTTPARVRPQSVETPPSVPVRYTHWIIKGRLSNQLTQTYISPNWSSGGVSNMSTLSAFYWVAKYDNKRGIQFDNFVDIKLGLNTVSNDSLRKVNISNDHFQASSKLGVRAIKNFYYSASLDFITQLLTNYKTNTYEKKAAFLSPATLYAGLGMDYKIRNNEKGYTLSVLLTPLTYRLNYLNNIKDFNPKAYGIDEGKHFGQDLGFKIATSIDKVITEFITWNSYFYLYTDFAYIDSEWKNTFNFNVNHYLSTQLFIHMKMNTKNERAEGERLIQFKEFLSFGLVYYW